MIDTIAPRMPTLENLNRLTASAAEAQLLSCCASRRWALRVAAGRPYADGAALLAAADAAWDEATDHDVLEALGAHPRIGERDGGGEQERREQAAAAATVDDATAVALREGNSEYEERFGHIYLVFASGRSAPELLTDLRSRLGNDAATELRVAAEQQRAITRLRLERLLQP
jgi:2-oxo-4-hydroxy-4-carboxy-5-ureidoimidazoline decarboxylase